MYVCMYVCMYVYTILAEMRSNTRYAEGENSLNTTEWKRGFIKWTDVLKRQRELQDRFLSTSNKATKEAYDLNQQLLLVSLYSLSCGGGR